MAGDPERAADRLQSERVSVASLSSAAGKGRKRALTIAAWSGPLDALGDPCLSPAARRLDARLNHLRASLHYDEHPLLDALSELSQASGITIHLSEELRAWIRAEGLSVRLRLEGIALRNALALILCCSEELDYERDGEGGIRITRGECKSSPYVGVAVERAAEPQAERNEALLQRRVTLRFEQTPLDEVLTFLSDITGAEFLLSSSARESKELPVDLQLSRLPLEEALAALSERTGLSLRHHPRGVVLETAAEAKAGAEWQAEQRARSERAAPLLGAILPRGVSGTLSDLARAIRASGLALDLRGPAEGTLWVPPGATVEEALERATAMTGVYWRLEELEGEARGERPAHVLRLSDAHDSLRSLSPQLLGQLPPGELARAAQQAEQEAQAARQAVDAALGLDEVRRARDRSLAAERRALCVLANAWAQVDAGAREPREPRESRARRAAELAAWLEALSGVYPFETPSCSSEECRELFQGDREEPQTAPGLDACLHRQLFLLRQVSRWLADPSAEGAHPAAR